MADTTNTMGLLFALTFLLPTVWIFLSLAYAIGFRLWIGRLARRLARQHAAAVYLSPDQVLIEGLTSAHARLAADADAARWAPRLRRFFRPPFLLPFLPAQVFVRGPGFPAHYLDAS